MKGSCDLFCYTFINDLRSSIACTKLVPVVMGINRYFIAKWQTKRRYTNQLILVISVSILKIVASGEMPGSGGIGVALGFLLASIVYFGPIVYVDSNNIKIKKPSSKFVEPKLGWMIFLGFSACILVGTVMFAILSIGPINTYVSRQLELDSLIGGMIMSFYISSVILLPVTVYMVVIKMRYKRIVEYESLEWRKLRNHK